MKSIIFFLAICICLPFFSRAQDFSEADIPTVKEIQATIPDLMVKGVNNFEGMQGEGRDYVVAESGMYD